MKRSHRPTIGDRSRHRCWYCGCDFYGTESTKDHQIPRSQGGKGGHNLVLACKACNNEKGCMDVETYRCFLQEKNVAGTAVVFYGERCPQPWWMG